MKMRSSIFVLSVLLISISAFLTCTNEIVDFWWKGGSSEDSEDFIELSMPIGAYSDYKAEPIGNRQMLNSEGSIGFDAPLSERVNAISIWRDGDDGKDIYFEYLFPAPRMGSQKPKELTVSFEACSEFNGRYENDWPTDITITINKTKCGTWTCPSDLGERDSKLPAPRWMGSGPSTRYGMLAKFNVSQNGTTLAVTKDNIESSPSKISGVTIDDLNLPDKAGIVFRISIEPDAVNNGGINLFGSTFGDYPQDILLSFTY